MATSFEEVKNRIHDFQIFKARHLTETMNRLSDFYDGYQWEQSTESYTKVVANDTLANIDIKCRALAFDDPEPVVEALDEPNEEGERTVEGIVSATFKRSKGNKEIKKVVRMTNVLGFAATHLFMDETSGWPRLKAIDPRTIAFDPEMEDWDYPEWVAICRYVPKWELEKLFGKAETAGLVPDVVRRRKEQTEDVSITTVSHQTGNVDRILVWEYWQREDRVHAIFAEQRTKDPLLFHRLSEDPDFPESLVIPVRFLTAVPAIGSLVPHSYVELGMETQRRLNEAMTSLVMAYKRLVPSMITRKGTFDTTEKRKMMQGEIGEIFEAQEDVEVLADAIQNMPSPALNAAIYPHLERLERQLHMYHNVTEYHQGVQVSSRTTATEAQGRMRFSGIRGRGEEQDLREHLAELFYMIKDMWTYYAPGTVLRYRDATGTSRFVRLDQFTIRGLGGGPRLDFPCHISVREGSTIRKDTVLERQAKLQLFSTLLPALPGLAQMGVVISAKKLVDDLLRSYDVPDPALYYEQPTQANSPEPTLPLAETVDNTQPIRYNPVGESTGRPMTDASNLPEPLLGLTEL